MIVRIVARIGRRRNRMNPILRETLRMGETDRFYRRSDVVLAKLLMDRNKGGNLTPICSCVCGVAPVLEGIPVTLRSR
jgi:hypothetical protein